MSYSFNRSRLSITCCKDCKPPKRYPGCGDHCPEYKEQKAKYEADKERERKNTRPPISQFEFNINCHHDPRKRARPIHRD